MWKWKNEILEEIPENKFGFIYKITNIKNNTFYIGKKQFYNSKTVKLSKKKQIENYSGRGRKKITEKKIKESDWRTYCSSSTFIKNDILKYGIENFKFEIIDFAENANQLKYLEIYHQLTNDIFRNKFCLNEQIIYRANKNTIKW